MTALIILVLLFVLNVVNLYPIIIHWIYTSYRGFNICETCVIGVNFVLCSLFAIFYYSMVAPILSGVAVVVSVLFFLSAFLVGLSGVRCRLDDYKIPNIVGIVGNIIQIILIIIFCSVCM